MTNLEQKLVRVYSNIHPYELTPSVPGDVVFNLTTLLSRSEIELTEPNIITGLAQYMAEIIGDEEDEWGLPLDESNEQEWIEFWNMFWSGFYTFED